MHPDHEPANVRRPSPHAGGDPEGQQHGARDDHPLPPAKRSFHATESSRMSDAWGVGFLPISCRRAKIAAWRTLNASTTAGSNWRPDPLSMGRAAHSQKNPLRESEV